LPPWRPTGFTNGYATSAAPPPDYRSPGDLDWGPVPAAVAAAAAAAAVGVDPPGGAASPASVASVASVAGPAAAGGGGGGGAAVHTRRQPACGVRLFAPPVFLATPVAPTASTNGTARTHAAAGASTAEAAAATFAGDETRWYSRRSHRGTVGGTVIDTGGNGYLGVAGTTLPAEGQKDCAASQAAAGVTGMPARRGGHRWGGQQRRSRAAAETDWAVRSRLLAEDVFRTGDRNGDGVLSRRELSDALAALDKPSALRSIGFDAAAHKAGAGGARARTGRASAVVAAAAAAAAEAEQMLEPEVCLEALGHSCAGVDDDTAFVTVRESPWGIGRGGAGEGRDAETRKHEVTRSDLLIILITGPPPA